MNIGNEIQVQIETEFNNLNNFNRGHNSVNIGRKKCSYCNKLFTEELWCKKCDPRRIIEGWTSGNNDIDKFIKNTIYYTREFVAWGFLEWVSFDKFKDIEQIGEGGFSKIYSATWNDGKAEYRRQKGVCIKKEPQPIKVALKRLNGSQNITAEYLNKVCIVSRLKDYIYVFNN
jgi:hypothetical protein